MQLDIPKYLQQKNSTNCQAVCTQMVLHYYGDMLTMDEIMKGLRPYIIEQTGMHSEGPAIWLAQRGYNVTYISHDLEVIDEGIQNITNKDVGKLRKRLAEISDSNRQYQREKIELTIKAIEAGVTFSNEIPDLSLVDEMLSRKIPVRLGARASGLQANPGHQYNHSVLVVGKKGNDYMLNDPNPDAGPSYLIDRKQLLMAWYVNSARTLIFEPKQRF
jgi:hypothetical protein